LIDGGLSEKRAAITLERPPRADFGDYSTNAALLLAAGLHSSPREVAQRLGEEIALELGVSLERFEVAGPGFLNLFLTDEWLLGALEDVLSAGVAFGSLGAEVPERILVEFVSANPTGPMHVGHARNAAYGDALARVLSFHGHRVEREFYVNDAGSQVRKLGESVQALARGEEVAEDGYRGSYVEQLVHLVKTASMDPAELGRAAVTVMVGEMQASLAAFAVHGFDRWAYESDLHEGDPSPVAHALEILEQQGHTYRDDGALWLRTTDYGDDKDRVLVRSSGEHTYFASDIAYHQDKRERGFDRQIDVWGADHHGYVARMKAAYEALGGDPRHLELLIMQLVHLMRGGERVQMSKRSGEFVTLDDLLADVGVDAARWYLLARPTTRRSISISTWHASSPARTPCTTCSTPTRGSFRCLPRWGRSGSGRSGIGWRWTPRRALPRRRCIQLSGHWSSSCSPFPRRYTRPPSAAPRTGSRPTRSSSPRVLPPSIATAAWSVQSPRRSSRGELRCLSRRSARSRAASICSG